MKRTTLFLFLFSITCLASAQRGQRTYFFEATAEGFGQTAYKPLMLAVTQVDPKAMVSIDGTLVKVAFSSDLDVARLITAMQHAGVGHFAQQFRQSKSNDGSRSVDRPIYQDTGNPDADRAAYDAAKSAWRTAHPELLPATNSTSNR